MRSWFALFVTGLIVAGCHTTDDTMGIASTPVAVSGPAAGAIAGDMASRLAEQLPPAATTLKMKSDDSEFAVSLEAALKGWGYSLAEGAVSKDAKPVELAYALQGLDGQILVQLSTPSVVLGRAYSTTPSGAAPASPLSLLQRN